MFINDKTMNALKIAKLNEAGFTIGSAKDFLGLTKEELAVIEFRRTQTEEVSHVPRSST